MRPLAGGTVAVLPVKRFGDAKQRLDVALAPPARRALAEAMLSDVLTALDDARLVDGVVVVTSEERAADLARAYGAEAIGDPAQPGHSAAAAFGVAWAVRAGARRALLVPGDCPALEPADVDGLLEARDGGVTVVPDRHGTGTNALLLAPPGAIAPSFGPGSRARHEAAASAARLPCVVAEPRSLVLDVDTAEDLHALRAALSARPGSATRTRQLLGRL